MTSGDFYGNEQSICLEDGGEFKIELVTADGKTTVLKDGLKATKGEVLDGTFIRGVWPSHPASRRLR